MKREEPAAD